MKSLCFLKVLLSLSLVSAAAAQLPEATDRLPERRQEIRQELDALRSQLIASDQPLRVDALRALGTTAREVAVLEVDLLARASRLCEESGDRERAHLRRAEAKKAAAAALRLLPVEEGAERSKIHFRVGLLEEQTGGDLQSAAASYREALKEVPEHVGAARRLARIENRLRLRGLLQ